MNINEEKAENTPAGGVLIGKKDGQTIIHDEGTMSGYLVGKLHKDGGIKAVNKATGQPLEMQGGEVVITAPAVADQTKREFEGKMMTNREILSTINEKGGGVSFAAGGDIPAKIHTTDCEYKFGGKLVKDTDIAHSLGMNSTLKKGKQQFSSGDSTYDVDAIYNAIKKGKLRLKTKEVETFPMKYPVYDKNYAENHKIDFRKPNGITVRTESGEEVLIDGNHRMNNAYLKGRKTMKTYYVEDVKEIAKFTKKNKFELGGENKVGGHLSKGKSLKQIAEMHNVSLAQINDELAKGLEVEKEHFADFKERTRVAKDHLVENPNYYTLLSKAGLKNGGQLKEDNLVKDAKNGNTPARDLNNYNDVLDLEADGMVGGDSGIFADGGSVNSKIEEADLSDLLGMVESDNYATGGVIYDTTKPKVEKLEITSTYDSSKGIGSGIVGRYATKVSELEEIISEYISTSTQRNYDYISFSVNGKGLFYIDLNKGKKNTVKNVNPETINATNIKRVIDAKGGLVRNYDWTDFFEGAVTKTTSKAKVVDRIDVFYFDANNEKKATSVGNAIQLYNLLKQLANDGKAYVEFEPKGSFVQKSIGVGITNSLWQNILFTMSEQDAVNKIMENVGSYLFPKLDFSKFNSRYNPTRSNANTVEPKIVDAVNVEVITTSGKIQETAINAKQLLNIFKNLYKRVDSKDYIFFITPFENQFSGFQEKGVEVGNGFGRINPETISEEDFSFALKVRYPDLDWSYFLKEKVSSSNNPASTATQSQPAPVSVQPFDFTDTKINVKYNPTLSQKVQMKAFELGWEWENNGGKVINYEDFNYLYFTKTSISYGISNSSFNNSPKREITEEDIFDNQITKVASTNNKKPLLTDLSNTKIWIGDNPEFSKKVQERAFELGWQWASGKVFNLISAEILYFYGGTKHITYSNEDREDFDKDPRKEIFADDLFEQATPSIQTTSNVQTTTSTSSSVSIQEINDLKEAVTVLEGVASQASQKYNTAIYDDSLEILKEAKEDYELTLSFTPESSFMYERIELMKKTAEIQKEITRITELKNGGAFYILSKVIDRLERGENWKELGVGEIMTNEVPEQEIEAVIYTEKFKNWFGNWEQALITKQYDYVSKAVTESGKPSVMYHGAKRIKYSYRQVSNGVVYLAENRSYAEWFSASENPFQKEGDYLTQCFVNLKNPIDLTPFGVEEVDLRDIIQFIDTLYPLAKIYDVLPPNVAMAIMNNELIGRNFRAWYIIRQFPELNAHIRDNTSYDGFIYYENNPSDIVMSESGELVENITKATAVFNSNQVKLVDAMLFDSSLDDWRFEKGGKVN